jgi:hypothetical protein
MKSDAYEEIMEEAKDQYNEYMMLDFRATHRPERGRKEDFLYYWIAVIAYQQGRFDQEHGL